MVKKHILLVEDDAAISSFMLQMLRQEGFEVELVTSGKMALASATAQVPDLILLDLGLPDIDGQEVLATIRSWSNVPIIIISAREFEESKVIALDNGADDYITKPFGKKELLARIRTALRHSLKNTDIGNHAQAIHTIKDIVIDEGRGTVSLKGKEIHLTPTEYKLLVLFADNIGKVLTYDFILKNIWGPYYGENERQKLRVNMANIRKKIEAVPTEPEYIITEVSVGYRMLE